MDNQINENTNETVILNGQQVSQEQLKEAQENVKKGERIKEVKPGEYRTQQRMFG